MDKVMLALVAFSSGVANLGKVMDSSGSRCIGNSVPSGFQRNHQVDYQRGRGGRVSYPANQSRGCMDNPPDDYHITDGIGAHKLLTFARTWDEARKHCVSDQGQLAIINSDREATILRALMKEKNVKEAWIGIHDLFKRDEWVTLTGESLESAGYTLWTTGEPTNVGDHNCGTLKNDEKLNDIDCNNQRPYICKIYIC